jgi:hypothetical protein
MSTIALPHKSVLNRVLQVGEAVIILLLAWFVEVGEYHNVAYSPHWNKLFSTYDPARWVVAQPEGFVTVTAWTHVCLFGYAAVEAAVWWWLLKMIVLLVRDVKRDQSPVIAIRQSLTPALVWIFLVALTFTVYRVLWAFAIWGGI